MTTTYPEVQSAPPVATDGELAARCAGYRTRPVAALDHHFAIRTDDPLLGRLFEALLVDFPTTGAPTTVYSVFECPDRRGWHAVYVDGTRLRLTRAPWFALGDVVWHINQRAVQQSSRYVLVHAAAAELDGIGVLLPAGMEAGKTTLVAGLVQHGFRYLTDEAAALDPDSGLVHPYPKALSIDRGSWAVLPELAPVVADRLASYLTTQWQVPATRIRDDALAEPTTPRLIITPRYVKGHASRLEALGRAQMASVLVENTFDFRAAARRNLAALAHAVRHSACYRLTVGDLESACRLVHGLVSRVRADRGAR